MFAQPWAWLGLLGLAVPLAIHLLARQQAVRARFPTLRFIDASELSAIRRRRLTDLPLLLVRLAIVTAVVAAIAGPRWPSVTDAGAASRAVAVVVDASAGVVGDAGPAAAREAVQGVVVSVIVEAESLPTGIASAAAWLARQAGRRELVVVSDFQRGALTEASLASLPVGVGVRFVSLPLFAPKRLPGFELVGDRARMSWPVAPAGVPLPLSVRAGADQPAADAMLSAVASLVITAPVDATARRAALVFRGAPDFAALTAAAAPINQPWMFDILRALPPDTTLRERVTTTPAGGELVVLIDDDPAALRSATIAAAVLNALLQPLPWSEFEPEAISPETLRQWERAPSATTDAPAGEPKGRWLWALALVLLGVETWMRRRVSVASPDAEAHVRVA